MATGAMEGLGAGERRLGGESWRLEKGHHLGSMREGWGGSENRVGGGKR